MGSGVPVEIEYIGFGDRFEMREGKVRIENKADASNFGSQASCYINHKDKVNIKKQVLVREDNEFSRRHVKFKMLEGTL